MKQVGVRELKNSLSRYLGRVKDGEIITITDRNKPVARLVPISAQPAETLLKMLEDGRAAWLGGKPGYNSTPVYSEPGKGKTLGTIAAEDRR
jgi:prevent-host-death family protein